MEDYVLMGQIRDHLDNLNMQLALKVQPVMELNALALICSNEKLPEEVRMMATERLTKCMQDYMFNFTNKQPRK